VCVVRVLYPSFYLLNIMKRSSPVRKKMNSNDNSSHSFVSLTFFGIFMQLLKIQILMMKINPQKMINNTLMKCILDGVNNLVKLCTVAVY
jgi:hypothetical protein